MCPKSRKIQKKKFIFRPFKIFLDFKNKQKREEWADKELKN